MNLPAALPAPNGAQAAAPADAWTARLQALAASRPEALALLHKEQGQWRAYRWADVLAARQHLAQHLQAHGLDTVPLGLCGAFEPRLLLLALAADARGAGWQALAPGLAGAALQEALQRHGLRQAYVQHRQDLAAWAAQPDLSRTNGHLYTGRPTVARAGLWDTEALVSLPPGVRPPARSLPASLRVAAPLWAEEGTEWTAGLGFVLDAWLGQGACLALPESPATAARDRAEIQPVRLLLSPAARERLVAQGRQRLPVRPAWVARLGAAAWCQAVAGVATPQARAGWLARRVARQLGLGRLTEPLQGPADGPPRAPAAPASPAAAWTEVAA